MENQIPISYFFAIWIKTSLWALATGLIAGYMFMVFAGPYGALIGLFSGLVWGQWASYRYFWGSKKGQFEYEFYRFQVLKKAKIILKTRLGWFQCQRIYLSEFGEISWSEGKTYDDLLYKEDLDRNERFFICIRAAQIAIRKRKYEKAVKYIEDALKINILALVPNFMLAQSFERIGETEKALFAYQSASKDPLCRSKPLIKYIADQLERVKTKGPSKKPPIPGLRHLGMGR